MVILLSAVYAPSPARLTTLPTLVLLATLFRLGLNVSTTRRILAEADGGEVVRAFGDFVARGARAARPLAEGDAVEIVAPRQGG